MCLLHLGQTRGRMIVDRLSCGAHAAASEFFFARAESPKLGTSDIATRRTISSDGTEAFVQHLPKLCHEFDISL